MAIGPGTRVGKYEVRRLLGQGGFGMVFVGHDTGLDRDCALKFLLPEHTSRPEILQRFLKEARSAAKIDHGGIVTVFECGVVQGAGPDIDGMAYIAMELLKGESLADRLQRGPLAIDHAIEIARQVASALAAAHAAGIVHRDLKPDNIYLVPDPATTLGDRVKVLDFGIAKLADEAGGSANKTSTHMIFGTPKYMSPEQCKSTAKVDERSDIYALGCILFEMVCGRPPFEGDAGELIAMHQLMPAPIAATLRPDLPPALDRTISSMLAKKPAERSARMTDVLALLGARVSALTPAGHAAGVAATLAPDAFDRQEVTPAAMTPSSPVPSHGAQVAPTSPFAPSKPRAKWPYLVGAGVLATGAIIVFAATRGSTAPVALDGHGSNFDGFAGSATPKPVVAPELSGTRYVVERARSQRSALSLAIAEKCSELDELRREERTRSRVIANNLDAYQCGTTVPPHRRPDPAKVYAIPLRDAPFIGAADAKVTIVMGLDYSDSYTARVQPTLDQLRQRYGRDLRIVFKPGFAQQSLASSVAVCAAAKQGKLEAYDATLLEKSVRTNTYEAETRAADGTPTYCFQTPDHCPLLVGFANELKLDVVKFKADMTSCADSVADHIRDWDSFLLRDAPVFAINGRILVDSQPLEAFTDVIDVELAKATARIAQGTRADRYYDEWVVSRGLAELDPTDIEPARAVVPHPELDLAKAYPVPIAGDPFDGPADALVTMVVGCDYASVFCERGRPTLPTLAQRYRDDLRIVYKHVLTYPANAMASALAFCAAAKQGKHREMDALLWDRGFKSDRLDLSAATTLPGEPPRKCWETPGGCRYVVEFANDLGLDIARFNADMKGPCLAHVRDDSAQVEALTGLGTPTYFINGRCIVGGRPLDFFISLIDEELAKARKRVRQGTPRATYYERWVLGSGK